MKLLLVDDEEYVIESIKRNLDLTETGVSEVCTAFYVQQAKNIMEMVDIDIVISDIVMPVSYTHLDVYKRQDHGYV